MPTHRKQFGKRDFNQRATPLWGPPQTEYPTHKIAVDLDIPQDTYAFVANTTPDEAPVGPAAGNPILQLLGLFFGFKGRIGRLGYWALGTFNSFAMLAITTSFLSALFRKPADAELILEQSNLTTLWPVLLALVVSGASVQVRRLHDRDVSGYWMLSWFIPIVGLFPCAYQSFANMFFAGTQGPNRFDDEPGQTYL